MNVRKSPVDTTGTPRAQVRGAAALTAAGALLGGVLVAVAPGAAPAAAVLTCDGKKATIVGTAGDDTLVGTPGPDVIVGLGGNDELRGRGGADVLCGGAGNDRLFGGADHVLRREGRTDWLKVTGDVLVPGPGKDLLNPGYSDPDPGYSSSPTGVVDVLVIPNRISYAGSARGVHIDIARGRTTGQGLDHFVVPPRTRYPEPRTEADYLPISFVGSARGDVLRNTRGGHVNLFPGPGNDVAVAHRGSLDVEEFQWPRVGGVDRPRPTGNDHYESQEGPMWVRSHDGRDEFIGGPDDDTVSLEGSTRAQVSGGAGKDVVLASRTSSGEIHTGDGDDLVTLASAKRVKVTTGAGNDTLRSMGPGRFTAWTGTGDDVVDLTPGSRFSRVHTEEGDDHVMASVLPSVTSWLGSGDDTFTWYAPRTEGTVVLDLRSGATRGGKFVGAVAKGTENWRVLQGRKVRVVGSKGADRVQVRGARELTARLGKGDDHIAVAMRRGGTAVLGGGAGQDTAVLAQRPAFKVACSSIEVGCGS